MKIIPGIPSDKSFIPCNRLLLQFRVAVLLADAMKINKPVLVRTVAALSLIISTVTARADGVSESQAWLAVQLQPKLAAYIKLNDGYKTALNRLLDSQTQSSNLSGAIDVRKEIETFADGRNFNEEAFKKRISETLTPLKQLQTTYLIEHARLTTNLRPQMNQIASEFTQRLEADRDALTRDSKLAEAQQVEAMIKEMKRSPSVSINNALLAANAPQLVGLAIFPDDPSRFDAVEASLLLHSKGEIEIYHNARKIPSRNQSTSKSQFAAKVSPRTFRDGDTIVVKAKTPYVYRAIVVAFHLSDRSRQIPVILTDWKFLGEDVDPEKLTTEDVLTVKEGMVSGTPDEYGTKDRVTFGFVPENKGGSHWVKTRDQLKGYYCAGFVITADMLKR